MPYGMTWDEFKPNGYSGSDWHDGPIITPHEPRKNIMKLRILKSDLADLKNPKILEKYPHLAKDVDKRIAELEALIKEQESNQ